MSITIEPTVRVETRRQPLPPRERLERIFGIESLDAMYGGKSAVNTPCTADEFTVPARA